MSFFFFSAAICTAYLWGSLSWAVITGKAVKGIDIRKEGSGNAGATNAVRVLGKKTGSVVLILDVLKGMIPLLIIQYLSGYMNMTEQGETFLSLSVLLSIMTGHMFPVWFGFKGGKGVACGAGGITIIFPWGALICLGIFSLVATITKYVSLASLAASWALPLLYYFMGNLDGNIVNPVYFFFFTTVAIIITLLHYKNIKRLLQGRENKISLSDKNQ